MTRLLRQAEPWPAMSWMLAGAICLAPGPPLLAQPVYKVTDADGDATFTNTPQFSDYSTIEKHSVQAPNSAKPTQTTLALAAPAEAEEPTRCDTRIVTPADNATVPMVPGNFAVQAAWNPRLASGETLKLLLGGEPIGAPQQTTSWQLSDVYRGKHRLQVVRLDQNGAQFDVSAASTVYVLRPSVNR
jgi:cytochrome c5